MRSRFAPLIAVALTALFFSTSPAVSKHLLLILPPFTVAFLRFGSATILFLPLVFKELKTLRGDIMMKSLPIFLLSTGNIFFFYLGVRYTTANMSVILYTLSPLITGILTAVILRAKVPAKTTAGITIGLVGAFITLIQPLFRTSASFGTLKGNLLVLGAVISWSLYTIGSRQLTRYDLSVKSITFLSLATNTVVFFVLSVLSGEIIMIPAVLTPPLLVMALYLGIFVSIATFVLYQWAIKHSGPVVASLTMYLQPIFGVIVNYILLGERLTVDFILSSIVIIFGVILASQGETQKNKT